MYVVLSRRAKIAATVAAVGAAVGLYGKFEGHRWANLAGTVVFLGAAAVYFYERIRLARASRKEKQGGPT